MIHRAAPVALAAALASPFVVAAQTPPGGHQVTPQIVEYVVAETVPSPQSGFSSSGIPTVVEVGGVYTVAFRGSVWPSNLLGLYWWDTTMTSPLQAFKMTDLVPSIELPGLVFSGSIASIDGGVPPALSTNGSMAQIVTLTASSPIYSGQGVVRHAFPSGLDSVACNSGQAVNGASYFLDAITRPISIDASGTVGFQGSLKTSGGGNAGTGIFRDVTTGIDRVAATGDPADGTVPATSYNVVGGNSVSTRDQQWDSSSKPAFFGTAPGATIGANGIWAETGTGVVAIALSGEAQWPAGAAWSTFESPSINDSGDVTFKACVVGGACLIEGIWAKIDDVEKLVAKTGTNAPLPNGAPSSETFVDFGMPVIDAMGRVAFWATTNHSGGQGIWIADGTGQTGLRRVARRGDVVRGTTVTFDTFFQDLGITDTGQVAFTAVLSDSSRGLFVESELKSLIKLARTTELFVFPNGSSQTIQTVNFYPGASSQGVGGFYGDPNSSLDSVAVAYQIVFSNGQSAVILTTIGP